LEQLKNIFIGRKMIEKPDWFIKQRDAFDAGIAVLGMALRKSYEDTAKLLPRNVSDKFSGVPKPERIGVMSIEMARACYEMGVLSRLVVLLDNFQNVPKQEWRWVHSESIHEYTSHDLTNYLRVGGCGIIGVENKGGPAKKGMHWIYVEGPDNVYDPAPSFYTYVYESASNIRIGEALLVNREYWDRFRTGDAGAKPI